MGKGTQGRAPRDGDGHPTFPLWEQVPRGGSEHPVSLHGEGRPAGVPLPQGPAPPGSRGEGSSYSGVSSQLRPVPPARDPPGGTPQPPPQPPSSHPVPRSGWWPWRFLLVCTGRHPAETRPGLGLFPWALSGRLLPAPGTAPPAATAAAAWPRPRPRPGQLPQPQAAAPAAAGAARGESGHPGVGDEHPGVGMGTRG